ncbi:unnamed protein product [Lampetra planeri]
MVSCPSVHRSSPAQPSLTPASAEKMEVVEENVEENVEEEGGKEKMEVLTRETRERKKRSGLARVGRAICSFFCHWLLCGGVSTAE